MIKKQQQFEQHVFKVLFLPKVQHSDQLYSFNIFLKFSEYLTDTNRSRTKCTELRATITLLSDSDRSDLSEFLIAKASK